MCLNLKLIKEKNQLCISYIKRLKIVAQLKIKLDSKTIDKAIYGQFYDELCYSQVI